MKLRKHLRTKKLENIAQLGIDRVVDLTFGKGENAYHILVELYASGNVILTDSTYTILSLLRSHKFEEDARIAVKQAYPFTHAANLTLDSIVTDRSEIKKILTPVEEAPKEEEKNGEDKDKKGAKNQKGAKKGPTAPTPKQKKIEKTTLKSALTKIVPYASFPYADHALRELGVENPAIEAKPTEENIDILVKAAQFVRNMVADMEHMEDIQGFITYTPEAEKPKVETPENDPTISEVQAAEKLQEEAQEKILTVNGEDIIEKFKSKILKEFMPCELLAQHRQDETMEYWDFDVCVDEYFSQAEKHKEKSRLEGREN